MLKIDTNDYRVGDKVIATIKPNYQFTLEVVYLGDSFMEFCGDESTYYYDCDTNYLISDGSNRAYVVGSMTNIGGLKNA